MANVEVECDSTQDAVSALEDAIQAVKKGDMITMSHEVAIALHQSFVELEAGGQESEPAKPVFFHVAEQNLYFQASAIALVTRDQAGNALIVTVNGATIGIEALQWQRMKPLFEAAVELVRVPSTGRLVSA